MYRPPLRQQSAEIRQRMEHIRSKLPWSMDRARDEAQRLTSWKFYVRRYPWVAAGALAFVGYWLVPKRRRRVIVQSPPPPSETKGTFGPRWLRAIGKSRKTDDATTTEVAAKSSMIGVATSFLVSSAVRMATAYAGNQAQRYFASRMGGAQPVRPMPRAARRYGSQTEQIHDR